MFQKGNKIGPRFQKGNQYSKGNQGGKNNRKEIAWKLNENGCHICTSHALNTDGYPRHRQHGKMVSVSHTIFEKYKGEIPDGMCVCHTCDTPACINPSHLFLGTQLQNIADRNMKNRQSRGEKHAAACVGIKHNLLCTGERNNNAKVTEQQVIQIRMIEGKTLIEIAQMFGVSKQLISLIRRNEIWKHVI